MPVTLLSVSDQVTIIIAPISILRISIFNPIEIIPQNYPLALTFLFAKKRLTSLLALLLAQSAVLPDEKPAQPVGRQRTT
jgi:hypothetical protein